MERALAAHFLENFISTIWIGMGYSPPRRPYGLGQLSGNRYNGRGLASRNGQRNAMGANTRWLAQ